MAQRAEMAEKKRAKWDGVEVDGLAKIGEISLEKAVIDVPSFKRIKKVQSDVTTLPAIELEYIVKRDGATLKFFEDFYTNNETKDLIIIRTDGAGNEFPGCKKMYQSCECIKKVTPAYEAGAPTYCRINVAVIYDDEVDL